MPEPRLRWLGLLYGLQAAAGVISITALFYLYVRACSHFDTFFVGAIVNGFLQIRWINWCVARYEKRFHPNGPHDP